MESTMSRLSAAILLLIATSAAVWCYTEALSQIVPSKPKFGDDFQVMWADDHVQTSEDGSTWHLVLDQTSGSGFQSKNSYRHGWFSMKLKLVPGDSAGVVTAYYMSSNNENHDELDFEFLGNRSGQPYVLQTNMFVNGVGEREQRVYLWFDPTIEFHTYSVLWNTHLTVFYVDQVPIRVHEKTEKTSNAFPWQPMYIFSSIWNGDQWATRGGLEKINWLEAPFVSSYEKFHANACQWSSSTTAASSANTPPACASTTGNFWWDQPRAWSLTPKEKSKYVLVKSKQTIYDYCTDVARYPTPPAECTLSF